MARFTLPRDLYHGKGALEALKTFEGKKAMICVGGGSMKRFGFLDRAVDYLKEAGMEAPLDCRIEDSKRTGEDFTKAKEALGDLARSEEDVMSYICFPDQTVKFLEGRKAKEENKVTYTITEA